MWPFRLVVVARGQSEVFAAVGDGLRGGKGHRTRLDGEFVRGSGDRGERE